MPKPINIELASKIAELNKLGLTDGEIGRQLGIRGNHVNWYRTKHLQLPPNWIKRLYDTEEDKLKGYIIRGIKSSAKRRNIHFDLDYTDLILPTTCPILGIQLDYKNFLGGTEFNSDNYATVDRFDNTKGYIKGNVWIISRLANNMKNKADLDELHLFCTSMLNHIETHRALGNVTDS